MRVYTVSILASSVFFKLFCTVSYQHYLSSFQLYHYFISMSAYNQLDFYLCMTFECCSLMQTKCLYGRSVGLKEWSNQFVLILWLPHLNLRASNSKFHQNIVSCHKIPHNIILLCGNSVQTDEGAEYFSILTSLVMCWIIDTCKNYNLHVLYSPYYLARILWHNLLLVRFVQKLQSLFWSLFIWVLFSSCLLFKLKNFKFWTQDNFLKVYYVEYNARLSTYMYEWLIQFIFVF